MADSDIQITDYPLKAFWDQELSKEPKHIQTMADLLRQGATLTDLACPACSSPLFRLSSGELRCAQCQKRVVVVKEGETEARITRPMVLDSLESTILVKIQDIDLKIKETNDPEQLQKLGTILSMLLENLERIKKIRGT